MNKITKSVTWFPLPLSPENLLSGCSHPQNKGKGIQESSADGRFTVEQQISPPAF